MPSSSKRNLPKKKATAGPKLRKRNTDARVARSPSERRRLEIVAYVESQTEERVLHAEKAASERIGPTRHEIWDVHCEASRWWVVTSPTNLYSQNDFKSRDVVLTFHIGLTTRIHYLQEREIPVRPEVSKLLPGSWRRWQQTWESYVAGDEAEDFQAVGVRLRECLVSFASETQSEAIVPKGHPAPKNGDVKAWSELLANNLAPGSSVECLRSYLKKHATETWNYVNWPTHAKNAVQLDAEIALKAVEHLLGVFSAAALRKQQTVDRCRECASYLGGGACCEHCGWKDPDYTPPQGPRLTKAERARRLEKPCVPSSDIATFLTAQDAFRR